MIYDKTDLARVEAKAEPSMPAHFADSTDWKAKYAELEKQSNQYKSDLDAAVMLYKTLSNQTIAKEYELMVQIDKLKNYIINQLIND